MSYKIEMISETEGTISIKPAEDSSTLYGMFDELYSEFGHKYKLLPISHGKDEIRLAIMPRD